jgi:hypothetical protein
MRTGDKSRTPEQFSALFAKYYFWKKMFMEFAPLDAIVAAQTDNPVLKYNFYDV